MMKEHNWKELGFATRAIHGGGQAANAAGALATPIYQASTFTFSSAEQGARRFALEEEGYIYTRLGNPNSTELEKKMALLEGAEAAVATGSGMGAITSAFWSVLKTGDHIVAGQALYGCSFAFFKPRCQQDGGVEVTFVDASDPRNVQKALRPNTKVVYLETPQTRPWPSRIYKQSVS